MYAYNLGIRFQSVAESFGNRTALWFEDADTVTYRDLNRLANQIARMLQSKGIGTRSIVCLEGQKTLGTFASMLACLKLGAAYVFLDPDSPSERLRKIVDRCRPRAMLGQKGFLGKLGGICKEIGVTQIQTDSEALNLELAQFDGSNLPESKSITGANPAYIMFTSGSTGFPKGAVMTHANVLNLIDWSREHYHIVPDDILTNVNPVYFDNSVFDIYTALFNGACLVPFTKDEVQDPKRLVDKIETSKSTFWFSVPSLLIYLQTMRAFSGKYFRSIRSFSFGGEGYPKAKLKQLFDIYKDSAKFYNVYGPTECTCICSSHELSEQDFSDLQGLPTLGEMAANFDYLILDEDGKRALPDQIGELCLLGPQVGKGYYNDPERTASAFVQNPFNEHHWEWMYKTGDLVRLNSVDGKLYVHGRIDNQIKHMGYRIELEEIEAALHCLAYVSEAAALYGNIGGGDRIVAVIQASQDVVDEQIRNDLKEVIPAYMMPSKFFKENILPKNANGKVDRPALRDKYLDI